MKLAVTRIAAFGIAVLATAVHAGEPREVHIDVGSSGVALIATVHVEDYRAASIDLLTPAATGDSPMTRLMRTYYEVFRTGDTKRVASLFEPHLRADAIDHYPTPQTLTEHVDDLLSARMVAVLHWGEYQFSFAEYERTVETGGTHRWSASHAARCVGDTCHINHHFANGQLGRRVAAAFANKGGVQLAVPAQGETTLPILPAVDDAAQRAVATNPIVLHLNRASEQTTLAVTTVVSASSDKLPTNHAPWNVSSVYSLGPDVSVAVLKSNKGHALHLLPLQRNDKGWKVISDPSSLDAWSILSSISTSQALQSR